MPPSKRSSISDADVRALLKEMETMPAWVPQSPMPFDADFIGFIKKILTGYISSLTKQFHGLQFQYEFASPNMDRLLGPDWHGHALRHEPIFWHRSLREPDITKLIDKTLLHDNQKNIRAFLRALCTCCDSVEEKHFIRDGANIDIVGAEVTTRLREKTSDDIKNEKGRIDNIIVWGNGDDARIVVIEAKFDAKLDNPLDRYEAKAKEFYEDRCGTDESAHILYVLLVQNYIPDLEHELEKLRAKEQWHIVYWQDLLPKWETFLKENNVTISRPAASVRHSIFQKIYGGSHGH